MTGDGLGARSPLEDEVLRLAREASTWRDLVARIAEVSEEFVVSAHYPRGFKSWIGDVSAGCWYYVHLADKLVLQHDGTWVPSLKLRDETFENMVLYAHRSIDSALEALRRVLEPSVPRAAELWDRFRGEGNRTTT